MRVLITGASGFVGRRLAAACLERGWQVAASGRGERSPAALAGRVRWHQVGDLADRIDYGPALAGAQAVVHLAARVHEMTGGADLAAYRRCNAEGAAALAAQAQAAGVERFVFLSTVKVNGERSPGADPRPLREADAPAPADPYAASKWEAEQRLGELFSAGGLITLRPPLVYGPGVGANFLRLLRWVDRGIPLPLAAIDNRRSLLYTGNLCDAICTALAREPAPAGTFFVADDEAPSTPALVRALAAGLGRPARLWPLPGPLLRAGAAATGQSAALARLTESLLVDTTRIARELDWQPPVAQAAGIAETCAWYRGGTAAPA